MSEQRRYGYRRGDAWAIEPRFEKAEPFHHRLAAVRAGGLWGYIDSEGRLVIEPRFETPPPPFSDGNFAGLDGLDRQGRVQFRQRLQGSEGLFPFNEGGVQAWDGRWGFRDTATGEVVVPAQFGKVYPFFGEYAAAMQWIEGTGGRWGLIDRSGAWVIEPTWLLCNGVDARGGLFGIKQDGVYLYGAVHPVDGETAPFEERPLTPDRSRLDPVWPPSKPRRAEDEALVVDSVMVEVEPSPPKHPFRFYGSRGPAPVHRRGRQSLADLELRGPVAAGRGSDVRCGLAVRLRGCRLRPRHHHCSRGPRRRSSSLRRS